MSGAITQLISLGAQDIDIGVDQNINSFKQIYKRHTNFTHFWSLLPVQGKATAGNKTIINVIKKGDLLSYITLKAIDSSGNPTRTKWNKQIDKIEFRIGEQVIDSLDADYIANLAFDLESSSHDGIKGLAYQSNFAWTLQVPFWFCRNYHSALPLLSITNQNIEIHIYWKTDASLTYDKDLEATADASDAFDGLPTTISSVECLAHFITVDVEERSFFLSRNMHLLITQHQTIKASNAKTLELNISNPVKFICAHGLDISSVYTVDSKGYQNANTYHSVQITTASKNAWWDNTSKVHLEINGQRVAEPMHSMLAYSYLSRYHHSPGSTLLKMGDDARPDFGSWERIFLYPFCLDTSSFQPTGTLNFSRINKARLVSDNASFLTNGYAVNYNILRIQNGVAGVMYAN